MEGYWFDLQDAWARASGGVPDVTCKRDLACVGGTRRDFILGCPLATAALGGCWVDHERCIQPHFSVGASFSACRWSARVVQPVRVTPLWPASWVSTIDKTRNSKSAEVRDIWKIYDDVLQFVPVEDAWAVDDALVDRDPHLARERWSSAAKKLWLRLFRGLEAQSLSRG